MTPESSPNSFEAITAQATLKRIEDNLREYNHALAGIHIGNNTHISLKKRHDDRINKSGSTTKQTALDILLSNPAYEAAYKSAMQAYDRAQTAVYDGLSKAAQELAAAESIMNDTLDGATTLDDGTKVFMAQDGSVYTEDGRKLDEDECVGIDWKEGAPSWEKYQKDKARLTDAQKQHDYMLALEKRLEGIHNELENGADIERIPELEKDLEQIEQEARKGHITNNELETDSAYKPVVPEMDLGL
jgi:hypothetical protein